MAAGGKLSKQDVELILELYRGGQDMVALGRKFSVSSKSIDYHLKKWGVYNEDKQQKIIEEEKEKIKRLYSENKSTPEMAKILGLSEDRIYERLRRLKLSSKERGTRRKIHPSLAINEEAIIKKYLEFGKNSTKTGEFFGLTKNSIDSVRRKANITSKKEDYRALAEDNKEKILEKYNSGIGVPSLATEFKIKASCLFLAFRRWGIEPEHPLARNTRAKLKGRKEDLYRMYFEENKNIVELSEIMDICGTHLAKVMKGWGWKLRDSRYTETSLERNLKKILEESGIKYSQYPKLENRVYDFILPEYNILLEANGNYWHGNPKMYPKLDFIQKNGHKRDRTKSVLAWKHNFRILFIWELDVDKNREYVVDLLKSLPNFTTSREKELLPSYLANLTPPPKEVLPLTLTPQVTTI